MQIPYSDKNNIIIFACNKKSEIMCIEVLWLNRNPLGKVYSKSARLSVPEGTEFSWVEKFAKSKLNSGKGFYVSEITIDGISYCY